MKLFGKSNCTQFITLLSHAKFWDFQTLNGFDTDFLLVRSDKKEEIWNSLNDFLNESNPDDLNYEGVVIASWDLTLDGYDYTLFIGTDVDCSVTGEPLHDFRDEGVAYQSVVHMYEDGIPQLDPILIKAYNTD